MRMAENGEIKLDPFKVVSEMRRARNYLVQTLVQYQFVFKTILEAVSKRHAKAKRVRTAAGAQEVAWPRSGA